MSIVPKGDAHGAAVGATGEAGAMEEVLLTKKSNTIRYCYDCKSVLLEVDSSVVPSCSKCGMDMKNIGVMENG